MNQRTGPSTADASDSRRPALLLLRLLATRHRVEADACAAYGGADWQAILRMMEQHRLKPLLHWRLTHEHAHLQVPQAVRDDLQAAFRQATLRALNLQGDLLKIHAVLAAAAVAHIVLKGPFLALHAYPHPALRPMRDLDVLVPRADVLRGYELLLAHGCRRSPRYPGDPLSFLERKKHLPPVLAPSGKILLELHARLVKPEEVGEAAADLLDEDGVWRRRIEIPGGASAIAFMSPTDLLLHLIVHAAYDHRFDNGPLVLSDLAYLLERHPIDWPLFWANAARGEWTKGCRLLLRMADMFHAVPEAVRAAGGFVEAGTDLDAMAEAAALLSLRDVESRIDEQTLGAMELALGWRGKLGMLRDKIFPSRACIAAQFPVDPRSPAVVLGYLQRWWYVAKRAVEMSSRLRSAPAQHRREQRAERLRIDSLDRWLRHD